MAFPRIQTFDSSGTPRREARRLATGPTPPIDLVALRAALTADEQDYEDAVASEQGQTLLFKQLLRHREQELAKAMPRIEDRQGRVVGIAVKASATVTGSDFGGLRKLAAACGERFALGLVLHDHDKVVPFGPQLAAAPLSSLWA